MAQVPEQVRGQAQLKLVQLGGTVMEAPAFRSPFDATSFHLFWFRTFHAHYVRTFWGSTKVGAVR